MGGAENWKAREDFKQLEFSRIILEGTSFIVPIDEVDIVVDNVGGNCHVESVMLTQDQFDKLQEWEG